MKRSILSICILSLFTLVACNNQPAKRQNIEETSPTNTSSLVDDTQDEVVEEVSEEDIRSKIESAADMAKVIESEASSPDNIPKERVADQLEGNPGFTAEEREARKTAALERRRKKEEAQRARAIAAAERTGDRATINAENSRQSLAEVQEDAYEKGSSPRYSEDVKRKLKEIEEKNKAEVEAKAKQIKDSPVKLTLPNMDDLVVDHSDWDALLRKYVSKTGKVDYKGLKSEVKNLDKYLKQLSNNPPADSWTRGQKMAYWINAYNAFTVKLILKNYPTSSITNLEGGKPWDKAWIKLGDKTYTLNNIENDILRPRYKDARIHFAVNCAAYSCPPLLNRAWTATNMERHFEIQTRSFINNTKFNKISANQIEVSKIFEWYGEDFGNLISFLNKYSDTKINSNAKVTYKEYDWNLNE